MQICVGITDMDFYRQLSRQEADEVNFWSPGGAVFRRLEPGDLFLFKSHYPENSIVGGGWFVASTRLPPFLAWEAFREKNGVRSLEEMETRIRKYRREDAGPVQIACTILTEPFWFAEGDWIPMPEWKKATVRGRRYSLAEEDGKRLWEQVRDKLPFALAGRPRAAGEPEGIPRPGPGGFRVLVTEAYGRRCAMTGERTLPVLETSRIVPWEENGSSQVSNGLLLRSDFRALYDWGYLTVTEELRVEVSRRLREHYGEAREYYRYEGQPLQVLPESGNLRPDRECLRWHNEHIYLG